MYVEGCRGDGHVVSFFVCSQETGSDVPREMGSVLSYENTPSKLTIVTIDHVGRQLDMQDHWQFTAFARATRD